MEFLKDVLKASFNVQMGPDFKAEAESSSIGVTNADSIHACGACLDGKVYLFGEVKVDLTWKITKNVKGTIFDITLIRIESDPFKEFYVSLKNDKDSPLKGEIKTDWGECPNKKYKTTFHAINGNGKEVEGISISIRRNNEKQYTAQSSKSIYLYDGEYTASCVVDNTQVQQDFKVDKGASTITLKAIPYIASGQCGDNLTWTLDQNGLLTISGTGNMDDYTHTKYDEGNANTPWSQVSAQIRKIVVENSVAGIGNNAFRECDNLREVTIGNGVINIGEEAFEYCRELYVATLGNNIENIGWGAFSNTGLISIKIPSSVTNIGEGAFIECDSMTAIYVDKDNRYYCSVNGALLDKDKTIVIRCPAGMEGEYQVPKGVIDIDGDAFMDCRQLTNVIIPDSVKHIGIAAFHSCGLKTITLGKGVTNIDDSAFDLCFDLADVYYRGTEEQWASITIGEDNDYLTSSTIHYNS